MANFMAPSEAYQFREQFGAPTYTSVILEHVFGGILRYLGSLWGILGQFWAFWGHFGAFWDWGIWGYS